MKQPNESCMKLMWLHFGARCRECIFINIYMRFHFHFNLITFDYFVVSVLKIVYFCTCKTADWQTATTNGKASIHCVTRKCNRTEQSDEKEKERWKRRKKNHIPNNQTMMSEVSRNNEREKKSLTQSSLLFYIHIRWPKDRWYLCRLLRSHFLDFN